MTLNVDQGPCPCCGPELALARPVGSDRMTRNDRLMHWPDVPPEPAGGGDRLARWIRDTDPEPATEPPRVEPVDHGLAVEREWKPEDGHPLPPVQTNEPLLRRFFDSIRPGRKA
ncbi:hypothetical protein [Glycomyces lechevalierae]|uniref:Uncharacterized protein n=1 Tax=Glycomyces lechevalierae TaxID=256034 RepID=A0ABU2AK53_9ACTN|nr:hypothetical protein [Glycomyces lechevalierae]MDR7336807.1 hypothetical protein [Glycomyces lechevalierae]